MKKKYLVISLVLNVVLIVAIGVVCKSDQKALALARAEGHAQEALIMEQVATILATADAERIENLRITFNREAPRKRKIAAYWQAAAK